MTLYYRQQGRLLVLFGNTYAARDQIKALGATFFGPERQWRLPFSEEALGQVDRLCRRLGGGPVGGERPVLEPVEESRPETAGASDMTVSELMARVAGVVSQGFSESLWVTAEVQNLAIRPSGIFFDLAEARDGGHANATVTVRAILWRSTADILRARWQGAFEREEEAQGARTRGESSGSPGDRLEDVLMDGLKVRLLCRVQFYRERGQVTLLVEDLDPSYTKGALALAREKLLRELRQKGLDQAQKRLKVPPFPFRVGLVSAAGSRAYSDFVDQLMSLQFPGTVIFCPCPMQGESVPQKVVAALQKLAAVGCDLIVITRGGGSAADLRWFDAAEIAYGIATLKVPVVAAIGHQDDVAVAEQIAFERQKTPTAAADFVAALFEKTRQTVDQAALFLSQELNRHVEEFGVAMASLGERLAAAASRGVGVREMTLMQKSHQLSGTALQVLHRGDQRLQGLATSLALAGTGGLAQRQEVLSQWERELIRRDPAPWLDQGWTQLMGPRGLVRRIGDAPQGDDLRARVKDGTIDLRVIGTVSDGGVGGDPGKN